MDLACQKSISLTNCFKCCTDPTDKLRVGGNFKAYLFFELPPTVFLSHIVKAEVILFKIPVMVIETYPMPECGHYCVRPLLDFFSIYGNWYAPPRTAEGLKTFYEDDACMSYTQIDITPIATAWFGGSLENRGLVIAGAPNARQLVYASCQHETVGMRPMLRLTYEGISFPMNVAPCTVEVT